MECMPRVLRAASSLLAAGARSPAARASTARAPGPPAAAPAYRVGDRWVYSAQDGFRVTGDLGRDARGDRRSARDGITVRVTQKGPTRRRRAHRAVVRAGPGAASARCSTTRRAASRTPLEALPVSARRRQDAGTSSSTISTRPRSRPGRSTATSGSAAGRRSPRRPARSTRSACTSSCASTTRRSGASRPSATTPSWYAPAVRGIVREDKRGAVPGEGRRPRRAAGDPHPARRRSSSSRSRRAPERRPAACAGARRARPDASARGRAR